MSIFHKIIKCNQFSFILYLFLIPLLILIFTVLVNYILVIYVPANFRPVNLSYYLFIHFRFLILTIFDILIFYYLIKYPTEFENFFKIFLILSLIFTTYLNFNYAISKQFNIDIKYLIKPTYEGDLQPIYYGSLSYLKEYFKIFAIPYYTCYGVIIGYYLDSIAFICGLPYYLIHFILPSFLSLAWFFIWLLFVIALILMPYKKLVNIRNRLSNYLKKTKGQK